MKVANFPGRKNARRVNALATNKQQLSVVETSIAQTNAQLLQAKRNSADEVDAVGMLAIQKDKAARIQACIRNLERKIMPQEVAETTRTKKYRGAGSR